MSALRLNNVHKSFGGVPVLGGVSLDVHQGGITAILGPSGCGKTTLLRLVAGFLRTDDGSIDINGREVSGPDVHVPPEGRRLGYLAQEGALFPHLTVAQNIVFGLDRRSRRRGASIPGLLDLVSLDPDLAARFPHELSGGQQQRVALARTLAPQPQLVLLDEPFSALDASLRSETRKLVAAALDATGVTTLLVTHDQGEALSFADHIAVMRAGELAQVGRPHEVYDNPVDLPTAEFIGDTCTMRCVVRDGAASGPLGTIPIRYPAGTPAFDGMAMLMIRPEQLQIRPGGSNDLNGIGCRVRSVEYFGHDCVVSAEIPADQHNSATTISCRLIGGVQPAAGSAALVSVFGSAVVYPM